MIHRLKKETSEKYLVDIYANLTSMSRDILNTIPPSRIKRQGADGWIKIDSTYLCESGNNVDCEMSAYIKYIKQNFSIDYGDIYSILIDYMVVLEKLVLYSSTEHAKILDYPQFYNHTFAKLLDSIRNDESGSYETHLYNKYVADTLDSITWFNDRLELPSLVYTIIRGELITIMKRMNLIYRELYNEK